MPYGDIKDEEGNVIKTGQERKNEAVKNWRDKVMPKGYGKWLYERRKLRFNDAERFREVLESIINKPPQSRLSDATVRATYSEIREEVRSALRKSDEAEKRLGEWIFPEDEETQDNT